MWAHNNHPCQSVHLQLSQRPLSFFDLLHEVNVTEGNKSDRAQFMTKDFPSKEVGKTQI